MIAIVAISMAFVACKKDEVDSSRVIDAKSVFSSVEFNSVKALLPELGGSVTTLSTANYKNNSFKLTLPKTVSEDALAGDVNGKLGIISFGAFRDNMVGALYLVDNAKKIQVSYIYANKDFKVNATFIDEENPEAAPQNWNCSFVKGWNMVYLKVRAGEVDVTTTKPSGVNLQWYCEPVRTGQDKAMPLGEKTIQNIMKNFSAK